MGGKKKLTLKQMERMAEKTAPARKRANQAAEVHQRRKLLELLRLILEVKKS